jgi:hypothetical protein
MAPPFCPFGEAAAASPRGEPVRGRVVLVDAVAGAGRDVLVRPLAPAGARVAGLAVPEARVPLVAALAGPVAGLAAFLVVPEPAAGLAAPDAGRAALWALDLAAPPAAAAVALAG